MAPGSESQFFNCPRACTVHDQAADLFILLKLIDFNDTGDIYPCLAGPDSACHTCDMQLFSPVWIKGRASSGTSVKRISVWAYPYYIGLGDSDGASGKKHRFIAGST